MPVCKLKSMSEEERRTHDIKLKKITRTFISLSLPPRVCVRACDYFNAIAVAGSFVFPGHRKAKTDVTVAVEWVRRCSAQTMTRPSYAERLTCTIPPPSTPAFVCTHARRTGTNTHARARTYAHTRAHMSLDKRTQLHRALESPRIIAMPTRGGGR